MKSVSVVAVYTVCTLMLLSCWTGMYRVWVCVEQCDVFRYVHLLVVVQNNTRCMVNGWT